MRKIVSLILVTLMCMCLFTGCVLFDYDYERDYKQVAVKIDSVQIDGGAGVTPYTAPEKKIYKYDVVTYFNQVASTLVNDNGYSVSDAVDYCVDQLVVRELLLNEAEAQLSFGNIVWSTHEENLVKQSIYTYVDSKLASLRNEILSEHGYPTAESSDSSSSTTEAETTYPVKEEEEAGVYDGWTRAMLLEAVNERTKGELTGDALDDLYNRNANYSTEKLVSMLEALDLASEAVWTPDTLRYPGLYGTDDVKSLELESMRRFMAYLEDSIKNDYRLAEKDRKDYLGKISRLNTVGDEKGLPFIYPELGASSVIDYMIGDGYRDSVKLQLLQTYVTDSVDVTEAEVKEQYDALLAEQQQRYADASAFDSDITGGTDHLVYYPNGNYYYVKHILVPFSDEQTAELTAYKSGLGTLMGDDAIAAKKEALGRAVTGYEHRNGENYGKPLTIQQIYEDIETEMAKVKGSLRESAACFDDLIYKYNTDDGIFGNELGYVVKVTEGDEYDTTYMEEFSKAAKALYEQGVVGAISQPVATDYGVHILYLSKLIPQSGLTVGLYDYVSDSSTETMFEHLREEKLSSKTSQVFSVWQNEKVGNYQTVKKVITRYEKVYSDLKETD